MPDTATSPWPLQRDCSTFYGDPTSHRNAIAAPDKTWEVKNLQVVPLPWAGRLSWDLTKPCHGLRVHRLVAASLARILVQIWARAGESQKEIERLGLDRIGGGYCWRLTRGGHILSMHAFGAAVDFDPEHNAFGDTTPNLALPENRWVIEVFEAEGWVWGGRFGKPDGMHFQAARLA